MGMEDQGWTAYFAIKTCLGELLTIYGNGKQVRDLLHVEDLIGAYQAAIEKIGIAKGKIYNIGGGNEHSFSLLEYVDFLENLTGKKNTLNFEKPRPGDQKIYISDTTRLMKELSWRPNICHTRGLKELYEWVKNSLDLFSRKKILVDVFEAPSINQRFVLAKK
jgi:CDP-paratose 2-epimerase